MAQSVKALLFRRGALVAAVTTIAMMAAMVVLRLLESIVPQAWKLRFNFEFIGPLIADYALTAVVPFGVGVFLCLWLILPITGELELRFVVSRAVLAAVAGWLVLILVQFIVQLQPVLALIPLDFITVAQVGLSAVIGASMILIASIALVVLFAVFQWNWLKHHPAKFAVAGILDV